MSITRHPRPATELSYPGPRPVLQAYGTSSLSATTWTEVWATNAKRRLIVGVTLMAADFTGVVLPHIAQFAVGAAGVESAIGTQIFRGSGVMAPPLEVPAGSRLAVRGSVLGACVVYVIDVE